MHRAQNKPQPETLRLCMQLQAPILERCTRIDSIFADVLSGASESAIAWSAPTTAKVMT